MKSDTQTSPKAKQFTEELNELLKKYQYKLSPEMAYTKSGIVPTISIIEVVPPKTVKPEPVAPVVVEPTQPEGKETT